MNNKIRIWLVGEGEVFWYSIEGKKGRSDMDLKLKQTDFELPVSLTTKAFFITPAIFQPWVKLFIMAALIFYRAIVCDNKNALNSTFTNSKQ